MSPQLEVQLIAVVVAIACALPGVFLVLRQMAMVSDAISHAILPGIVVAFFLTESLNSPLLILAAAATGVLSVALIELLRRTNLVREDAAIGLVFPAMFSIGVILISRYAGNVHLDTDAVLLGELAFAPFQRLMLGGIDLGPKSLWTMGVILLVNIAFISLAFKELKLATLDAEHAAILGFSPALIHYGLMTAVSTTAVGAFDAVGSILVVALMIAPPAAAYILVDRLTSMLAASGIIGALTGVGGYWLARWLDASIAGSMAVTAGLLFGGVLLFAPQRGVIAQVRRRAEQRWSFAGRMLLVHLLQHEGTARETEESTLNRLPQHLRWKQEFSDEVARRSEDQGLIVNIGGVLQLTDVGRRAARQELIR